MNTTSPIDVFIAYAKADSDLLERLRIQLSAAERIGLVDTWHDGEIEIGTDTQQAMEEALNKAEIILLLISADFFASEVYDKELPLAMKLHRDGKAKVLPVILRECTWQMTPIAGLKVLPPNGLPVTHKHWTTPDHAFRLVVDEVVRLSGELRGIQIPTGTTTIQSEHKSITKTVIEHQGQGDKPEPVNKKWIPWLAGIAALIFVAWIGLQSLNQDDNGKPITESAATNNKETTSNKPSDLSTHKDNTTEIQNNSKKQEANTNPPQSKPLNQPEKRRETSLSESTSEQPTPDKETPKTYDQTESRQNEVIEPPKEYTLSNNTLTDLRDQKQYRVVSLNGLVWMGQNLNHNTSGALCYRNKRSNCRQYGGLYNFDLAQKACPKGWRMPSMQEWLSLSEDQVKALQLSRVGVYDGNHGWLFENTTGFYWTNQRSFAGEAKAFRFSKSSFGKESRYTKWSLSCRCVKDE